MAHIILCLSRLLCDFKIMFPHFSQVTTRHSSMVTILLYPHINCVSHLVREVILDLNLMSSDVSLRSRALCATTSSCRLQNTHHHDQFQ